MRKGLLETVISGMNTRTSHAQVVNELGRSIIAGDYPVGATLPGDAELAARFKVSRTVLREAMKTLAAKGLVVPRARIGTRVTPNTQWNLFDSDILTWYFAVGVNEDFLLHLSEGVDDTARRHFKALQIDENEWAITSMLAGIHCCGLQDDDYATMAAHHGSMVWSPFSNLLLYGGTSDVARANREGVLMALGPDWYPILWLGLVTALNAGAFWFLLTGGATPRARRDSSGTYADGSRSAPSAGGR